MPPFISSKDLIDSLRSNNLSNLIIVYRIYSPNFSEYVIWKEHELKIIKYDIFGAYTAKFNRVGFSVDSIFRKTYEYSHTIKEYDSSDGKFNVSTKYVDDYHPEGFTIYKNENVIFYDIDKVPHWKTLVVSSLKKFKAIGEWYVLDKNGNSYKIKSNP